MKTILTIIFLSCFVSTYAQDTTDSYVIVTIEKKTSGKVHPYATDYWIISRNLWKSYSENAVVPLYLYGFTLTDYNECKDSTLVLYNYPANELIEFDPEIEEGFNNLKSLIEENARAVQVIKKKWKASYKEELRVSITPVLGNFCFCPMVHRDGRSMPDYAKRVSLPVSGFSYDDTFWSSPEFKEIERFDFSDLDFVSLHLSRK